MTQPVLESLTQALGEAVSTEQHLFDAMRSDTSGYLSAAPPLAAVELGPINGDVNDLLPGHGLWFAPDPASRAISTIGGNIATNPHPNFVVDGPEVPHTVWQAVEEMFSAALSLGGTLTGEHGVGILKRRWLEDELGHDQLTLQREIKQVFDPHGILNPGKVF